MVIGNYPVRLLRKFTGISKFNLSQTVRAQGGQKCIFTPYLPHRGAISVYVDIVALGLCKYISV